ncbi:phosphoribosylanthranilate isomerase [Desulfatitalea alkaliphila]|uniref:N-(5'-phosphoribosyl)anthranilate isomerase n=1 Tax=Desulfatitalea alkaliphila TaxID=2929485 RepID=A0AA41UKB3_9BACT|nr:hypothetical protein [Desulfatitalea alkaliphila]MCJ8501267.1 hypothetical protein [Desulfatitalea alkaliphila]
MKIQIYEIQTVAEARTMLELGVDHIGSVLVSSDQWRDEPLQEAIATVRAAGAKSSLIPLFQDVDVIGRAIDFYHPDIIHFCDALPSANVEDPTVAAALELQRQIRRRFPDVAVMRSIAIGEQGRGDALPSLALAELFEPLSDWFLTDTVLCDKNGGDGPDEQPVSGFVGITGRICDWGVARELVRRSAVPVILAGGIGPHNVRAGIAQVGPAGVDSCTLTNAVDARGRPIRFKKDPRKVGAMVSAVRETVALAGGDASIGQQRFNVQRPTI